MKKTNRTPNDFVYMPKKHNTYYYRAQKMLLCFFYKSNMKALRNINKNFIKVFYDVLVEEFCNDDKSKADVNHIMRLIQYFYIQEPKTSTFYLLKTHFLFHMIGNIHIQTVQDTIISLFTPGDMLLKVKEEQRNLLYKYAEKTNLFTLLFSQIDGIDISRVLEKIDSLKEDDELKLFLYSNLGDPKPDGKRVRNIFLSFFHSFFNVKLLNKNIKQPEEVFATIQDIDGVSEIIKRTAIKEAKNSGYYKAYSVGTMNTFSNEELSNNQELEMMEHLQTNESNEEKKIDEYRPNILMRDNYEVTRPMKKSKALKVFHKLVLAVIVTNWLLNRKGYLKKQRTLKVSYTHYKEKIKILHPIIRNITDNKLKYFEKSMKTEKGCIAVLETIYSILIGQLTYSQDEKMLQQIRAHLGDSSQLNDLLFHSDGLLFKVFWFFLIKFEYGLENKKLFKSGYLCGKIFNLICSNM